MIPRGQIIAALLVVEIAIVGEAFVAVNGGQSAPWSAPLGHVRTASGSHLVEDGAHRIFDAATHPALTVDIGYADLTILTSKSSQIDVSLSASTSFGIFRATAPITAREEGERVRIATNGGDGMSMGDDRMVTVIVPPETQVTVVNAGNIRASGLRADASIHSVGSGTITVEDCNAPTLRVTSSNGEISLHQIVAARLDATSKNDRVVGSGLQVRDGSVESDGAVTLGFAKGADTQVTAATGNGKIVLSGFPAGASLATGSSGADDGDDHPASQTVRVGPGNGRLDVHASDGNVTLTQDG